MPWTIHASGVSGGSDKSDLVGCHIKPNDDNTAYEFTDSNNNVLTQTDTTSLPTPPFDFEEFDWPANGYTWNIDVTTLTGGHSQNKAEGSWSNNNPSIQGTDPQSGDWTAQAGSGADAEEAGAATSA